jgi:uncharacterized membrane protein YphA (DoxX/SURF4 family)
MAVKADTVALGGRLLVGGLFLAAGALKVGHFSDLAASIAAFRILPEPVVAPLAVFLPFLEIGVGVYLIAGFFTRAAAALAALMLGVYAAAIASAVVRHIPANCGCFGPQDRAPADWPHAAADALIALLCVAIALRGPAGFSLDARMRGPHGH